MQHIFTKLNTRFHGRALLDSFPSHIYPFAVTTFKSRFPSCLCKSRSKDLASWLRDVFATLHWLTPKLSGSLFEAFCDLDNLIQASFSHWFLAVTSCKQPRAVLYKVQQESSAFQGRSPGAAIFPLCAQRSSSVSPDGLLWCHRLWETLPGLCLWQLPWPFVLNSHFYF